MWQISGGLGFQLWAPEGVPVQCSSNLRAGFYNLNPLVLSGSPVSPCKDTSHSPQHAASCLQMRLLPFLWTWSPSRYRSSRWSRLPGDTRPAPSGGSQCARSHPRWPGPGAYRREGQESQGLQMALPNCTLSKASAAEGQGLPAHSFTHPRHTPPSPLSQTQAGCAGCTKEQQNHSMGEEGPVSRQFTAQCGKG